MIKISKVLDRILWFSGFWFFWSSYFLIILKNVKYFIKSKFWRKFVFLKFIIHNLLFYHYLHYYYYFFTLSIFFGLNWKFYPSAYWVDTFFTFMRRHTVEVSAMQKRNMEKKHNKLHLFKFKKQFKFLKKYMATNTSEIQYSTLMIVSLISFNWASFCNFLMYFLIKYMACLT